MPSRPTLSLVVPNYNFGTYLRELLAALNELKNRDQVEVILADGGSTDTSLEVAAAFLQTQDRLIHGPDKGQADAISKGLSIATGHWFMYQNSDDQFEVPTLEWFLANAPLPGRCDVVAFDQDLLLETTTGGWYRQAAFRHHSPIGWRQLSWSIYYTNQSTIYDRCKAVETGFDATKRFAMDYDFVVRFFKQHRPAVLTVDQVLGMQRMHGDTKTSTMQDVCAEETAEISRSEFSMLDRSVGFVQAALYHAAKHIARRTQKPTGAS